jgi:sulfite dehydrogenase (quinone) subunit SoeC
LTVINYVLLGGASGFTFAAGFSASEAPELVRFFVAWAMVITLLGLVGRGASLFRNARLKPKSTLQSAIGIKHPRIVQKTQGAMGGSFNTREFFHGKPAGFLRPLKWMFLSAVFLVPVLLLLVALPQGAAAVVPLGLAFLVQYLGLLVERWFFFAQASHPQNLYYQSVA